MSEIKICFKIANYLINLHSKDENQKVENLKSVPDAK